MVKAIWDEYYDIIIGTFSFILFLAVFFKDLPLISQIFATVIKSFMG